MQERMAAERCGFAGTRALRRGRDAKKPSAARVHVRRERGSLRCAFSDGVCHRPVRDRTLWPGCGPAASGTVRLKSTVRRLYGADRKILTSPAASRLPPPDLPRPRHDWRRQPEGARSGHHPIRNGAPAIEPTLWNCTPPVLGRFHTLHCWCTIINMMTKGFVVLLCVGAAGCGGNETVLAGSAGAPNNGSGAALSCVYTEAMEVQDAGAISTFCVEALGFSADMAASFQSTCDMPMSSDAGVSSDAGFSMTITTVWATQACSRDNVVGGCQVTAAGMPLTTWYYAGVGMTVDVVQMTCAEEGGTFVSP